MCNVYRSLLLAAVAQEVAEGIYNKDMREFKCGGRRAHLYKRICRVECNPFLFVLDDHLFPLGLIFPIL